MANTELTTQTIEELESLYNRAIQKGDEILADTIAYLISEKQQETLNS
jgi:hypothetical protein